MRSEGNEVYIIKWCRGMLSLWLLSSYKKSQDDQSKTIFTIHQLELLVEAQEQYLTKDPSPFSSYLAAGVTANNSLAPKTTCRYQVHGCIECLSITRPCKGSAIYSNILIHNVILRLRVHSSLINIARFPLARIQPPPPPPPPLRGPCTPLSSSLVARRLLPTRGTWANALAPRLVQECRCNGTANALALQIFEYRLECKD
jgi:hypothetical protein